MALRVREMVATGAPDGQSCWVDVGQRIGVAAATVGTSPTIQLGHSVQGKAKVASGSVSVADYVGSGNPIRQLNGADITLSAAQAAEATLTLGLSVYRIIGTLGSTGGASTTSVPLAGVIPNWTSLPSGSTITITKLDGSASTTLTTTAAVGPGASAIPVSSVNLTGYAIGSMLVWQVGNGPVLGWLNTASGTPALVAYAPTAMAWLQSANASIQGGSAGPNWLPLLIHDLLVYAAVLSTSTLAVPALSITTYEN